MWVPCPRLSWACGVGWRNPHAHDKRGHATTTSVGMAPNAVHGWTVVAHVKELVFQDFEPPVRLWFLHKLS